MRSACRCPRGRRPPRPRGRGARAPSASACDGDPESARPQVDKRVPQAPRASGIASVDADRAVQIPLAADVGQTIDQWAGPSTLLAHRRCQRSSNASAQGLVEPAESPTGRAGRSTRAAPPVVPPRQRPGAGVARPSRYRRSASQDHRRRLDRSDAKQLFKDVIAARSQGSWTNVDTTATPRAARTPPRAATSGPTQYGGLGPEQNPAARDSSPPSVKTREARSASN